MESEHILRMFFVRFVQAFFNHASQWKLECKFSSLNREWGYGGSCVCVCVSISFLFLYETAFTHSCPTVDCNHILSVKEYNPDPDSLNGSRLWLQTPLSLPAGLCFISGHL